MTLTLESKLGPKRKHVASHSQSLTRTDMQTPDPPNMPFQYFVLFVLLRSVLH